MPSWRPLSRRLLAKRPAGGAPDGAAPGLRVLVLRVTRPDLPRPFRCPGGKTVAALGALVCLALMLSMPASSWWRLGLWLLAGLAVYFLYGWWSGRFENLD